MKTSNVILKFIYKINYIFIFISILLPNINCNSNSFSIKENFFNDQIVSFYLGAIDITTGSSEVLFFDYEISSNDDACYLGDQILYLHFSIEIYSPDMGFTDFQRFSIYFH